jgi:hypothetical protein
LQVPFKYRFLAIERLLIPMARTSNIVISAALITTIATFGVGCSQNTSPTPPPVSSTPAVSSTPTQSQQQHSIDAQNKIQAIQNNPGIPPAVKEHLLAQIGYAVPVKPTQEQTALAADQQAKIQAIENNPNMPAAVKQHLLAQAETAAPTQPTKQSSPPVSGGG